MRYYLRKIITLFVTIFLVALVTFLAFNILPGDPALSMLGTDATPEKLAALHLQLGLDKPLFQRFLTWLVNLFHGDLGTSLRFSRPVTELFSSRLPVTLTLTFMSLIFIVLISVPLGILSARHEGKFTDFIISLGTQLSMSMPSFLLGILMILVFGITLRLFSTGSYTDFSVSPLGFLQSLLLPSLAIAIPRSATVIRFLRSSLLEQLNEDYVRTALSKGNNESSVVYRHVLKNALIPVITIMGMTIADILAGSLVIEQVFNLPGIGRLLISSISYRDFPLIQSIVVYLAFVVVLLNFLVDILYQFIDPRIRVR